VMRLTELPVNKVGPLRPACKSNFPLLIGLISKSVDGRLYCSVRFINNTIESLAARDGKWQWIADGREASVLIIFALIHLVLKELGIARDGNYSVVVHFASQIFE